MHDFNTDPDVDLSTLDAGDLLGRANWLKNEATILDETNAKLYISNDELQKKCDELTSTCEVQHRTIDEQSQTLSARQKLVDESQSAYTELLEQSTKEIDALRQANESIERDPLMISSVVATGELADALKGYGVHCAQVAANDVHNAVAVAFIQIAARIRSEGWSWEQTMTWFGLRTSPPGS